MAVLTPYRRILRHPGTAAFSSLGFVARLQMSMMTLGIVLLVAARTDSYALAGTVSAAFIIASTLLAVFQGRLLDRFGQRRILVPAALVANTSLVGLVWAIEVGAGNPAPHLFAALAGATMPNVGAAVRARWTAVLDDPAERQTAFALEAVVDEMVFIIGPPLATVLATIWHPAAGVATAAVTSVLGTLAFTGLRATEPPLHAHSPDAGPRPRMPWRALVPTGLICFALGGLFGSTEVVTVAFAESLGSPSSAGVLLGLWALGSLIAGVGTGAVTWQSSPAIRMRLGILALTGLMVPTPFIGSLVVMGVVLFMAGFAIAPTLIATVSMIEQSVPPARLTEGMALIHTTLGAGIAPGAAFAGIVIDASGPTHAYLVPVGSGLLGVVAAALVRPRRAVQGQLADPSGAPTE
jgi:predicted MFS family arabinose efflux permease